MDCKTFEKMIPDFIDDKLEYAQLARFRDHYVSCQECREELAIQYLVREGMARLEEGSAFDLQKELDRHLDEARKKIAYNVGILKLGVVAEIAVMTVIGFGVMWILFH